MEDFVAQALKMLNGDLSQLGDVFASRLSLKEELMLTKIDQEIAICVEGILDRVMAGSNVQGEMTMAQQQRDHIMELTAIRRTIHKLIKERGNLGHYSEGLN